MAENKLIQTFGRRKGRRLRTQQQHLLDNLLPQLSVKLDDGATDPATLFSHTPEQIILEIGFGSGEHLADIAQAEPENGIIGAETYLNGVAACLQHIEENNIQNIRLFADDARLLMSGLKDASLDIVYILHPDPWPKTKHFKRRIIQQSLLEEVERLLKKGGQLRIATDHKAYAGWMLMQLAQRKNLKPTTHSMEDFYEPFQDYSKTRYAKKALAGVPMYLTFVKQ